MENICQNCEYWTEEANSKGNCELQPQLDMYNFEADVLNCDGFETTDANDTCDDFEPKYEAAK